MKPPLLKGIVVFITAGLVMGRVVHAQDRIVKVDNTVQDVKVLNVTGQMVNVQVQAGAIGIPLATISRVIMLPPPDFAKATAAYELKDYPTALVFTKGIVDKFKGLPTDWAQQATSMLGDIYVAMDKLPEAEAAYGDFTRAYPGKGSLGTTVGLARIAFSKKDYAGARAKLDPIKAQAMKQANVPPDLGPAYSRAFYLLGQVEEAQNDLTNAYQDYLRTVTWFYQDHASLAAAQDRASALHKEHNLQVP